MNCRRKYRLCLMMLLKGFVNKMSEELKVQESEALDIIESLLDVADMKNTGPMYADNPPRSGMCRIPEDDATKLRQYITDRRAEPENKPLTLEQLRKMDGKPVWFRDNTFGSRWALVYSISRATISLLTKSGIAIDEIIADYGKTWLAYAGEPNE